MASTKIQNLPLKAPIGAMKIPTGGFGDYSITVSSIGDYIIDTFNLATKDYVDNLLIEKEDRIDTTGGFLTPVSQNSNVPDTTNDVIDEVAQALLDRIEYVKDNFSAAPSHNELTGRSATGAHPSTSISHKSGTVYTYLSNAESDINTINNTSIPTINQSLSLKQDQITTTGTLTGTPEETGVNSVSHTGINGALQGLLNRSLFNKNHSNLTNRSDLNSHPASAISYDSGSVSSFLDNQKNLNNKLVQVINSIDDLIAYTPRFNGEVVYVKSYYVNEGRGGGHFVYDQSRASENNSVYVFNGWVRQFDDSDLTISACGAKGGLNDDGNVWILAVSTAIILKKQLVLDMDIRISKTAELAATLKIVGNGGAVQNGRSITVVGDIAAITVKAGFSSESSCFENLVFKSSVGGLGAAFRSTSNGYLSQSTFNNCVFDRSLRYGIDANIILCDFNKCDFGTYQFTTNSVGFKAIRALGIQGTQEPNANTFYNCIFRRGTDDYMIEWDSYGTQWHFFACDFEQNNCTQAIISCTAASPIMFIGGYIEANKNTPYFIKTNGNSAIGFVPLITFQSVHFNQPALTAIAKNTMANYPKYKFEGCYGQIGCALWESSTGILNDIALLSSSFGNHFTLTSGGNIGQIHTETYPSGYNHYLSRNYVDTSVKRISKLQQAITAGQSKNIVSLSNKDRSSTYSYGGIVTVFAVFGNVLEGSGASATYNLLVNKSVNGQSITLISKVGDTKGTANGQPSFTFSISGNVLSVTPVGTSGSPAFFASFYVEATGNLSLA